MKAIFLADRGALVLPMLSLQSLLQSLPSAQEVLAVSSTVPYIHKKSTVLVPTYDILLKYAEHLEKLFLKQRGSQDSGSMLLKETIRSPLKIKIDGRRGLAFPYEDVFFMNAHKRCLIAGPTKRPCAKKVKKAEATADLPENDADPSLLPGGKTSIDILREKLRKYGVVDVEVRKYINTETPVRVSEHGKAIEDKVQEIHIYFE